jgi:hypothetical protein
MTNRRTLWDLAATDALEGRRVVFLADDVPHLVPKGSVGVVTSTGGSKACVQYDFPERGPRHPWRTVHLESKLHCLALEAAS